VVCIDGLYKMYSILCAAVLASALNTAPRYTVLVDLMFGSLNRWDF
jgi:hypothetical protein